jgi:hypothetical protein
VRYVIPYVLYVAYLWIDWVCLQDDADDEREGSLPRLYIWEVGLKVGLRGEY